VQAMKPPDGPALARRNPLDFTIQYPPRREYFQERFRAQPDPARLPEAEVMLLYLHVPFCQTKCYYCNFAVDTRNDDALRRRHVDALLRAMELLRDLLPEPCPIGGIDIGGGTPTMLSGEQLALLLGGVSAWRSRCTHPRPISIETTPVIAAQQPEKLAILADSGADRLSMGFQSTNAETLAAVNRSAQRDMGTTALRNAQQAGFARLNVDIIFGLPGQTRECWEIDLAQVVELGPDSITTYDCLYRGKGRRLTRMTRELPTPERFGELYDCGHDYLTAHGYHAPYGSANFSRHPGETGTSAYFEGRLLDGLPYLGLGNYAASWYGGHWWFAPYRVERWAEQVEAGDALPVSDSYRLPIEERMAKYILYSLSFGLLDPVRFRGVFGEDVETRFHSGLEFACQEGWLERRDDAVYGIRPGSFRHMPEIRSLFYSPAALRWVAALPRGNG